MVRVSIGSDLTRVSPSRLRMFARGLLELPPFVSQDNQPLLDVVTAASFLARHAGELVLLHHCGELRIRKCRNIGATTEDVIVALASDSLTEVPGKKLLLGAIAWEPVIPCPASLRTRISSAVCQPAVIGRRCGTAPPPLSVTTGVNLCRLFRTAPCPRKRQCHCQMVQTSQAKCAAVAR